MALVIVPPDKPTLQVAEQVARIEVGRVGPQGIPGVPGPTGPQGPAGEAWLPEFYESSVPPVGPKQGDQWIVNNPMEGN